MQLLIAVVNYHGLRLTIDCLRSLAPELEAMPGAHVGVCDNGSGPQEVQGLETAIEALGLSNRVTLMPAATNLGFTGGNNAILRWALESEDPPEIVFLLNNDTLVPPGAIQALVAFLQERPEVGLCGSRLEYPDGESQRTARRFLTAAGELEAYARFGPVSRLLSRWVVAPPDRNEPHSCQWVSGAALMVRRRVFQEIGLLDESFFTYFEDVDFCLRSHRAGWQTWHVPASRIVHLAGQSSGIATRDRSEPRRGAYWFRARRHYFLKKYGAWHAAAADAAALAGILLWKLRCLVERRRNPDPPCFWRDMIRHSVFVTGFARRPVTRCPATLPTKEQDEQTPFSPVAC